MVQESDKLVILGIDPGTVVMGYGLIEASKGKPALLDMGVLRLDGSLEHPQRLRLIFIRLQEIIRQYRPDAVALEAPFFGKNVQSMLKLGRAQGVAMAAAMMHRLDVAEYAPRLVKQVITGKGSATKEAVRTFLETDLDFRTDEKTPMDATDALAVALCHYYTAHRGMGAHRQKASGSPGHAPATRKTGRKKNTSAWEQFLHQNPDRLC